MKKVFFILFLLPILISCEDLGPMHTTYLSHEFGSTYTLENAENFTYEKEITSEGFNVKQNKSQIDANCVFYKKGFMQKKLMGNISIRINAEGEIFIPKKVIHD